MSTIELDVPVETGIDIAAFSERGPRGQNEDAYSIDQFASTGKIIVADGMGGARSGRLAAQTALEAILGTGPVASLDNVRQALVAADRAVAQYANVDPARYDGMGCAATLLTLSADRTLWLGGNIGDVRVLSRSTDGTVRLETRDHTVAFEEWEAGRIELDSVPSATGSNRLRRSLGHGGTPDVFWIPVGPGWSYAVITDGVSKAMRLDEIGSALGAGSASEACRRIREKIELRGADDNYTGVCIVVPPRGQTLVEHTAGNQSSRAARRSRRWLRMSAVPVLLALLALVGWNEFAFRRDATARLVELTTAIDSIRALLADKETESTVDSTAATERVNER
ncbi:MAG: PP2C family protein-serine/threonine phosphatase [Gemmatimonadota bacterium]